MTLAPNRPDRLVGSAWTRADVAWRYRHWQIVARRGDVVELAAVLAPHERRQLPWRGLRDRAVWLPGWRPVVDEPGPDPAPAG
ncbi:MAG: TIGR02450 family Trp-rich protein [Kofleriaceae bacterium]